jgi:hypothetical protein
MEIASPTATTADGDGVEHFRRLRVIDLWSRR